MTLKEAMNHMWLSETNKLRRSITQIVLLHEDFHDEFSNKLTNALSREEGTKTIRPLRSKKVSFKNITYFEVTGSESESD